MRPSPSPPSRSRSRRAGWRPKTPSGAGAATDSYTSWPKTRKDKRLTDEFLLGCVEKIGKTIAKEENRVRVGMGGALMSIGKRNKKLNAVAIKLAKAIGPIHFSDGDKKCEPMNVLQHLTSDYLRNKLGI
ncbi:MAG TPA: hypothetical protein VIZ32_17310 [Vicinamibacterales bacterium]